jgi:hypothetical protein
MLRAAFGSPPHRAPISVGAVLAALDRAGRIVCLAVGTMRGIGYAVFDSHPVDGEMFWMAGHSAHYYGSVWSLDALYVYPPPLAQVAGLIPWALFIIPWMVLIFASLWYATRWLSGPIVIAGFLIWASGQNSLMVLASPVVFSSVGNPQAIVAAAIVLGFRHPSAWAVVVLTKIGPGLGLCWFLVRREWRSLAVALGATTAVAAISFVAAPGAWADFIGFALANYATPAPIPVVPVPLLVRVPMALALVTWGALTDRRWTVPVAAGWSALALYESSYLILWASALPLLVSSWQRSTALTMGRPASETPSAVASA